MVFSHRNGETTPPTQTGDVVQYTVVMETIAEGRGYRQFLFHRATIVAINGGTATIRPDGCYSKGDEFEIPLTALRAEDDFGPLGDVIARVIAAQGQ